MEIHESGAENVPEELPIRQKRRVWPVAILVAVLIGGGVSPVIISQVHAAQADKEITQQIAALPTFSSTPTAPASSASSELGGPTSVPTMPPSGEGGASAPTPAVKLARPDSIPVNLTCESAGIVNLPVLPLPPQADPNKVDPPDTAKAVFWNPTPIIGDSRQFKVGSDSQTTALIQAHYLIDATPEAGFPFNKLSYQQYFPVGTVCVVRTDSGEVLTYREVATTALLMAQWQDDPKFGVLSGPHKGYDLILQACDAQDYHNLKRLVGFELVR